jgi:hypothetical protein
MRRCDHHIGQWRTGPTSSLYKDSRYLVMLCCISRWALAWTSWQVAVH